MATVPTPKNATPVVSGSVGRQRIDAPAAAFGSGAGLAGLGAGLASVGGAMEQRAKQAQQRYENEANSDLAKGKAIAGNIMTKYRKLAEKANSEDAARKLYDEAINEVGGIELTSDEGKARFNEWFDTIGKGHQDNVWMDTIDGVRGRVQKAQDDTTLATLTTSSVDSVSHSENRDGIIKFFYNKDDLTDGEKVKFMDEELRKADNNYAEFLMNSISNEDDSATMAVKLNAYKAFMKGAISLTDQDKAILQKNADAMSVKIMQKAQDEQTNLIYTSVQPTDEFEELELIGVDKQREQLAAAYKDIDENVAFSTPEDKALAKAKIKGMLDRDNVARNQQRKEVIVGYLEDKNSNLATLLSQPGTFTFEERNSLKKSMMLRQKEDDVKKVKETIAQDIQTFEYDPNNSGATIKMLQKISVLSEAEQKVFGQMLADKMKMPDESSDYKRFYNEISNVLNLKYELNGSSAHESKKLGGFFGKSYTYAERAFMKEDSMQVLRNLADTYLKDPKKYPNGATLFRQEAQKFLDMETEDMIERTTKELYIMESK